MDSRDNPSHYLTLVSHEKPGKKSMIEFTRKFTRRAYQDSSTIRRIAAVNTRRSKRLV